MITTRRELAMTDTKREMNHKQALLTTGNDTPMKFIFHHIKEAKTNSTEVGITDHSLKKDTTTQQDNTKTGTLLNMEEEPCPNHHEDTEVYRFH